MHACLPPQISAAGCTFARTSSTTLPTYAYACPPVRSGRLDLVLEQLIVLECFEFVAKHCCVFAVVNLELLFQKLELKVHTPKTFLC